MPNIRTLNPSIAKDEKDHKIPQDPPPLDHRLGASRATQLCQRLPGRSRGGRTTHVRAHPAWVDGVDQHAVALISVSQDLRERVQGRCGRAPLPARIPADFNHTEDIRLKGASVCIGRNHKGVVVLGDQDTGVVDHESVSQFSRG